MGRVTASVEVKAPPESVWALMSDPDRYPDFVTATQRMLEVPAGEFGLGSEYREYGGVPPFLSESVWKVTRFEPMRVQTHMGDEGKMRIPLDIELTPTMKGTRLTMTLGLEPRWFLVPVNALLWPLMMRKRAQEVLDATVANAKRIVEAGG